MGSRSFVVVSLFMLAACGPSLTATPHAAVPAPTARVTISPSPPHAAAPSPTVPHAPTLTTTPEPGPFRRLLPGEGPPETDIHDLWVDPQGYLWVASARGIFRDSPEGWSQLLDEPVMRVQGIDGQGHIWMILAGEEAIAAYDAAGTWSIFGPEQGWTVPPPLDYLSPGYGDGLATDAGGRVWLATGQDDLRRFDPGTLTWSSLTAADLGLDPPEEEGYQGHFLTDVEMAEGQGLWVSHCLGMGENLLGQGILQSDGKRWVPDPSTAGECVQDIEKDSAGSIWVGAFDAVLVYDPAAGSWSRIPLPLWERRQLVTDIVLDADDRPWIEILRYGGASPFGRVARFHLQEGEWLPDFEGWFSSLTVSSTGMGWLCSEGLIYRIEGGRTEEVGNIGGLGCEIVVDGQDRVWVTNHFGLWRQELEK